MLLGRYVFNATVAFDLQSDPYDQAQEFSHKESRGLVFDVATRISKVLHTITLQRADYVFVLSEPLAKSVIKNYGVDREVIRLIPLGVDTDKFTPNTEAFDRTSIVYIGSLARYRGIDTLLEAVSNLPDDIQRDVRVDLYGDGPEKYISGLITDVTDSGHIEVYWHGLIPHEEIPRRVAGSDIAVSPIPPLEAYQVSSPAKVFEYLAMGLPIVASRIEPHERILTDGENALLYDPESAADFSQQLERLVRDDEQRRVMAKNARESSLEYDWKKRFGVVEDVLLG